MVIHHNNGHAFCRKRTFTRPLSASSLCVRVGLKPRLSSFRTVNLEIPERSNSFDWVLDKIISDWFVNICVTLLDHSSALAQKVRANRHQSHWSTASTPLLFANNVYAHLPMLFFQCLLFLSSPLFVSPSHNYSMWISCLFTLPI